MRLLVTAAAVAALALTATAAAAQESAADAAPAPVSIDKPDVVSDKDKVVCRSVRTTSTRMPARVCETKGQKEERLKKARDRQVKMDTKGAEPYSAARVR